MPVMVWIYGGGFQFGEASRECYSPDYLLREDVVVISINYRLGPLGRFRSALDISQLKIRNIPRALQVFSAWRIRNSMCPAMLVLRIKYWRFAGSRLIALALAVIPTTLLFSAIVQEVPQCIT